MEEFKKQIYTLKIDPYFSDYFPLLSKESFDGLEKQIIDEGCRNPIAVWHGVIVDGHNRYKICHKNNIPFSTFNLGVNTKEEARIWMIDEQKDRRNWTEKELAYYIGEKYELEKVVESRNQYTIKNNKESAPRTNNAEQKSDHVTAEKIAKQYGIGERTVQSNAQYAKSIDTISFNNPELKQKILKEEIFIPKKTVVEIANKSEEERNKIVSELQNGKSIEEILPKKQEKATSIKTLVQIEPAIKKCSKCQQEKLCSEFNNGNDFCKECEKHIYEPTNKLQNIDNKQNYMDDITKSLKTEKIAKDYLNVDAEINYVCDEIINQINLGIDRIFGEDMGVSENMTEENINYVASNIDTMINKLMGFKLKIKNIKIKGDNVNE